MQLCMRCGSMNQPGENYCKSCGATLPKIAYTMEMASVKDNYNLYRKFEKVAKRVKSGQISLDEFDEYIGNMFDKLSKCEDNIKNVDLPDDIVEDFSEELDTGLSGIDMVLEGVEIMNSYVDEEDPAFLDEGLGLIKEGLKLVHKAKRINREREKKLSLDADLYRAGESIEL